MNRNIFLLTIIVSASFWYGCKSKVEHELHDPEASIVFSDEMLNKLSFDTVKLQQVVGQVELSGKVTADESKVLKVYPMLSGYAQHIDVQLGDYVRKGQLLAVVHSSEIADYENQLSNAQSNQTVALKKLQVEQDLYSSRLTTSRDVSDAQSEVEKSKAEINRLKAIFNIYRKGKGSTYNIIAPISGYIIEKNVNNNMEIRNDNNENLFTISEINDVWVIANVFESDIPKVKEGYKAKVSVISYPDEPIYGKIDKVYNFLDPATKTMLVRIRINNESGLLKPEMFATVKVQYPQKDSMMAIPTSSLIFDNNQNFVLIFKGNSDIEIRAVIPEITSGDITFIKKGIKPGELVISKNQLLIYNALSQN